MELFEKIENEMSERQKGWMSEVTVEGFLSEDLGFKGLKGGAERSQNGLEGALDAGEQTDIR